MAREVQYKGWQIESQSYQSDGARWRAKAMVSVFQGGSVHTLPVFAPLSARFNTKQEADAYAVEMAKMWIDGRDRG